MRHAQEVSSCLLDQRRAGVLLHPTSLPSHTLDDAADWLSFMADAGLSVWQMLPLGIPENGLSPYQCESAFAANPSLLARFPEMPEWDNPEFSRFCEEQKFWLDDFVLFRILKQRFQDAPWYRWPEEYKNRNGGALSRLRFEMAGEYRHLCGQQYEIYVEWQKVRDFANEKDIALFGDMPIFVAHDSADVWAHPGCFLLDDEGMPTVVTGVPPDYFSEQGQRWGNPHYDWDFMEQNDFIWWKSRLKAHFQWFDIVRIDHFRGLEAVWQIPVDSDSAINGEWVKVPGEKLLNSIQDEMGKLPLVAEDLGIITPEVEKMRLEFGLPGMSILQFSFDHFDDNPHKPANIGRDRVVYTGTHDNDTTLGWYRSLDDGMKQWVRHDLTLWLGNELKLDEEDDVVDAMIQTAMKTKGELAIIPMQDFLGLGTEARMNVPGTIEDNWRWSFTWPQISEQRLSVIRSWVESSERLRPSQKEA